MKKLPSVVFLKGKNVDLRPVMKSDVPHLVRWFNDPEVRYFLEAYLPQMEQDEEKWVEGLSKDKKENIVLVILTKASKPIGVMGIHNIRWRDRVATTGASIGEKEYWGKGLGSEAKMLLLDYAFNTLNLRKICSNAIAYNERSIRYSLKCGYQEEGRLKAHIFRAGEYHDLVQLAIFRDGFGSVWEKYKKRK
jgi:RimJ/RimL family protein N-acetyltransferase